MPNDKKNQKIAIIGSGPTGQGVLSGLLKEIKKGTLTNVKEITIFDPSEETFTGFPYGEKSKLEHHATGDATNFGIYDSDFVNWLGDNAKDVIDFIRTHYKDKNSASTITHEIMQIIKNRNTPYYFPPRPVVGLFFKSKAEETIRELKKLGIDVKIKKQEIIRVRKNNQEFVQGKFHEKKFAVRNQAESNSRGFIVSDKEENEEIFDKVACCTGVVPLTYEKPADIDFHIYFTDSTEQLIEKFKKAHIRAQLILK